jgi:hypothetical protein
MYKPTNIKNSIVLYISIVAIIIGIALAYFISYSDKKLEPETIRSGISEQQNIPSSTNTPPQQEIIVPEASPKPTPTEDRICAQVITPARDPNTGEIEEFPTPCDVPEGWELMQ